LNAEILGIIVKPIRVNGQIYKGARISRELYLEVVIRDNQGIIALGGFGLRG